MNLRGINKIIFKNCVEIVCILIMLCVSYIGLVNNNLSSYASIAEYGATPPKDLVVLYGKDETDTKRILENYEILDSGSLWVKNPNKFVMTSTIYLEVKTNYSIDYIDFIINGKTIDSNHFEYNDGTYDYLVENTEIEASEENVYDLVIKGDSLYIDTSLIEYEFKVIQKMYS